MTMCYRLHRIRLFRPLVLSSYFGFRFSLTPLWLQRSCLVKRYQSMSYGLECLPGWPVGLYCDDTCTLCHNNIIITISHLCVVLSPCLVLGELSQTTLLLLRETLVVLLASPLGLRFALTYFQRETQNLAVLQGQNWKRAFDFLYEDALLGLRH